VKLVLVGASSYNRVSVGDPLTVQLGIDNAAPIAQTVIRALTEVDYFGTTTTIMTGTVTVSAGQILTGTMTLATPNSGYFELHAALYDQTGTALSSSVAPFAVLRPQTTGLDPQSAFGINGGLTQFYGGTAQALDDAASAMAAAGIRYDREEFNWRNIEPIAASGTFSFAQADRGVIAAHQAGIQMLGLVDYWGNLPAPTTTTSYSGTQLLNTITGCSAKPACSYTPQGNALFAAYAAAVVARYRPGGTLAQQQGWSTSYGISDWEVWNEPSTTSFWRHDIPDYAARFAALYKAAAAAIRQVEPDARVMYDMSGSAIDNAVKAAKVHSDIISVHTYSGGLDPDAALESPTLPRGGQGTAPAALSSVTAQGVPVWITETGYTTDGTITNNQQAEYLVRSFVNFQAAGVKKNFWFKFHEDGQGTENQYGITSRTNAPKPAYVAYATMARHLQGADFAVAAPLGAAVRGDLFTRADGSVEAVLWSTAEPGTVTLS
ncbi:MAG: cellulase family glycosylhydrolase, partial [Chloroflexota bacterium]